MSNRDSGYTPDQKDQIRADNQSAMTASPLPEVELDSITPEVVEENIARLTGIRGSLQSIRDLVKANIGYKKTIDQFRSCISAADDLSVKVQAELTAMLPFLEQGGGVITAEEDRIDELETQLEEVTAVNDKLQEAIVEQEKKLLLRNEEFIKFRDDFASLLDETVAVNAHNKNIPNARVVAVTEKTI